jgi:hypothetical protein
MLSQGHIAAGVLGVLSSVGWAFQTFVGGWLYKTVSVFRALHEQDGTDEWANDRFGTLRITMKASTSRTYVNSLALSPLVTDLGLHRFSRPPTSSSEKVSRRSFSISREYDRRTVWMFRTADP